MSEPEVLWAGHEFAAGVQRRLVKYADSSRATWERRGIDGWAPDDGRMRAVASADELMLARALAAEREALRELRAAAREYLACDGSQGLYDGSRLVAARERLAAMLPPEPAAEAPTCAVCKRSTDDHEHLDHQYVPVAVEPAEATKEATSE